MEDARLDRIKGEIWTLAFLGVWAVFLALLVAFGLEILSATFFVLAWVGAGLAALAAKLIAHRLTR
jgi:hypothetical protein